MRTPQESLDTSLTVLVVTSIIPTFIRGNRVEVALIGRSNQMG